MPYKDKKKQASLNRKKQRKYLSIETNRQKAAARQMARNAYPIPQKCSVTGCIRIGERHLEIVWLCHRHHILYSTNY